SRRRSLRTASAEGCSETRSGARDLPIGSLPVLRLLGDDPADAAAGISGVTIPARDHMDVRVPNRLARSDAVVHANVESVRAVFFGEQLADGCYLRPERGEFLHRKFKYGSHVPLGDHERMAFGDRVAVEERQRRLGFQKNAFLRQIAEWARR